MRDSDYYPAGAYNDPYAPYNDPGDSDPVDTDVVVSMNISKSFCVPIYGVRYCSECDEDGGYSWYEYDGCEFEEDYNADQGKFEDNIAKICEYLGMYANVHKECPEKKRILALRDWLSGWQSEDLDVYRE